ncbi:MAG: DUF4430 domain-containing protein [Clostridiales Family XIII bacterium]|jgi:hypothetical protein|nr:DUF4430 domain-containing protein [Clostridiales Family XIII bacterium]
MQKHRTKILFAAAAICLLAAAWVFGGNYANRGEEASSAAFAGEVSAQRTDITAQREQPEATDSAAPPSEAEAQAAGTSQDFAPTAEDSGEAAPAGAEQPTAEAGAASAGDSETDKDRYLTDPIPDGKPIPVEPQDVKVGGDAFTATLTVRCDTIRGNMDMLDKEKWELVPADGVIFAETAVVFYEGESVFNVLQREMKRAKIHMEFENTPIYNSAYIEGIHNLYEFDVGELSGWMYRVNGWYPNYGCSRYQLKDGDVIEWRYTCDLGRDLGVEQLGGAMFQRDE